MKAKSIILTILFSGITSAIVVFLFIHNYQPVIIQPQSENYHAKLTNLLNSSSGENVNFVLAANNSVQSVVHVKTQYKQQMSSGNVYDFFFGPGAYSNPAPVQASGSGVIISDDGYIVTNNHVISNADYIEVVLNDKRAYTAKLIGADPTTDIALLKIEEKELPFIQYGNSDVLQVGEWVLAVGNPFNLTSTVTAGIVSAKARNINILSKQFAIESFIQTDAAVNPGNSGGALVDSKGQLVGINTAIASNTGSFTGYSFAIPVNIVKKIIADLIEFGTVQRAYLGVSIVDLDNKLASEAGISKIEGVYVASLNEDGAATEAGLEKGDIITQVNDKTVNNVSELQEQVSMYRPGDKINITVKRNEKLKPFNITLRNKHGNTKIEKTATVSVLGAKFEEISINEKQKLRIKNGIKITDLGSGKLRAAGIKEGFIITSINRKFVYSLQDIEETLSNTKGGILIEGIYPNGMTAYYAFGM